MDIVVEDGTGLPTANSYLDTDTADDLLSVNIYSTWSALTDDVKENLLIWASRILDERVVWFGKKSYPTSGLAWPRTSARDKEGYAIDSDVVPASVQMATAILANFLVSNGADPEALDSSNNLTTLQVDVIKLQFDTKTLKNKYPVELKNILEGVGRVNMGSGGPKFIVRY